MSDDNRIIIDAANFDRSMPKWATEESLSRLSNMIKSANKEEQKTLKAMQQTLRDVSRLNKDAFNRDKKNADDTLKELKKISKLLAVSNDNAKKDSRVSSSKSSNSNDSRKSIEDLKSTTQKSSENTIKSIEKLTTSSKEGSDKIVDSVKSLEKSTSESSKSTADAIKTFSDKTHQHNEQISSLLEKANDVNSKSQKLLEEIQDNIKNLTNVISKEIKEIGDSDSQESSASGSSDTLAETRFRESVVSGMYTMNRTLSYINSNLEIQNRVSSNILGSTTSKEDFTKLFRKQQEEYTRIHRRTGESTGNNLRDMFERSRRAAEEPGSNAGLGKLAATMATVGRGLNGILRMLRVTPLGAALAGAAMVSTAVTKAAEYTYDAQKEFRDMAERGFNFRILGDESLQDDGSSRLDGITVRRTITQNEIGLETATKILEHNTRLINNIGLSTMFEDVGEVLGKSTDPNSLANRLGMTRDQIAVMTGDFFAIQSRVSSIADDFTSLERQSMAEDFVSNVRGMSQALGVSVDEIRNYIKEFTKGDDFLAYDMYMPGTEMLVASLSSTFGENSKLTEMIFHTFTSAAGAVDRRVVDAAGDMYQVFGPVLDEMLHKFGDIDLNDTTQVNEAVLFFSTQLSEFRDSLDTEGGRNSEAAQLLYVLDNLPLLMQATRADIQDTLRNAIEYGTDDPERIMNNASEVQRQYQEVSSLREGLEARVEHMFAELADSATGREIIMTTLELDELMKHSQLALVDGVGTIAELLEGGPIPRILSGVRTGIRRVTEVVQSISRFLGRSAEYTNTLNTDESGRMYDYLTQNVMDEDSYRRIFREVEDESGDTVIELQDGISSDEISAIFGEAFRQVESNEERDALAGLLMSLERGIDTGEVRTSQELQDTISLANEELRYIATQQVGGLARDNLEDIFDGYEDSVRAAIREPMRDVQESMPNHGRVQSSFGLAGSTAESLGDDMRAVAGAISEGRYVERETPLTRMDIESVLQNRNVRRNEENVPQNALFGIPEMQEEIRRRELEIRELESGSRSMAEETNDEGEVSEQRISVPPTPDDTTSLDLNINETSLDSASIIEENLLTAMSSLITLLDQYIDRQEDTNINVNVDYEGVDNRFNSHESEIENLVSSMSSLLDQYNSQRENIDINVNADYEGIDNRFNSHESEIENLVSSMSSLLDRYNSQRQEDTDINVNVDYENQYNFNNLEENLDYLSNRLSEIMESGLPDSSQDIRRFNRVTEVSRLDENEIDPVEILLSTTNDLIRDANNLAFMRANEDIDYNNRLLNRIDGINVDPLTGEEITIDPDRIFNQNPTVTAIENSRMSIVERLEWINTALGGSVNIPEDMRDSFRQSRFGSDTRRNLGEIAERYESGGRGVGTISTGIDDAGGVSYGKHQLASETGTMQAFLDSPEGMPFRHFFEGLRAGTDEFSEVYSRIAEESEEAFGEAQKAYITRTHYDPVLEYAESLGFDVNDIGIQEALFSQSVQHGFEGNKEILNSAMSRINDDSDISDIVHAIYDARGDYASQFASYSATIGRYERERNDVLALAGQRDDTRAQQDRVVISRIEEMGDRLNRQSDILSTDMGIPDRIDLQDSGTIYELSINRNRLIHETNSILYNILGRVDTISQTNHSDEPSNMIDHDELHRIMMTNIDNESNNVIDRDSVSSILTQTVQEYEQRMIEREESRRQAESSEINDSPFMSMSSNTPVIENDDNRQEMTTLLSQINTSNRDIALAVNRNTRTLQDYINRSI